MSFYISHREVQNYFKKIITDQRVFNLQNVPGNIRSKLEVLLDCESIPDDFSSMLEQLDQLSVPKETMNTIKNLVLGLSLVKLYEFPSKSAVTMYNGIGEFVDENFDTSPFKEMAWSKLGQDLLKCETLPEVVDCASVFDKLDQEKKEIFKKTICIQLSHVIKMTNKDLIENAKYLMFLKKIPIEARESSESIINFLIQSFFQIISDNEIIKEFKLEGKIINDEVIKEALKIIYGFPLPKEYQEKYEQLIKAHTIDNIKAEFEGVQRIHLGIESDKSTFNNVIQINNAKDIVRDLSITSIDQLEKIAETLSCSKTFVDKPGYLVTGRYKVKSDGVIVFVKIHYCNSDKNGLDQQAYYMAIMQNQPNFLKVYGSFWEYVPFTSVQGDTFKMHYVLVMELAEKSLTQRIKELQSTNETPENRQKYAYECASQLIPAFYNLNRRGISHRDIKPDNILVMENGELKIVDFDISADSKKNSDGVSFSIFINSNYGTKFFMAPELNNMSIMGEKVNYNICDVYSLGLTLLRIVTEDNEGTFNGKMVNLQKHVNDSIETYIQHPELKQLLQQMLVVDPKRRSKFEALTSLINIIKTG